MLGAFSAHITHDSPAQFHEIGSLLGRLYGDLLALLDQEVQPLRDRCDFRSDLKGRSRIAMEAPQHF